MESVVKISQFLDDEGKILQLPRKQRARVAVLAYLADKFEPGKSYTEQEVNAVIAEWHTFCDYVLLRRELIDYGLLSRERDGSRYWKAETENV